jgi:plastocyanin
MKRGMLLCMLAATAIVVLGMPAAALAGGGCHGGVTQNDATGEKATTVRMIDACFSASVTTVDPGTEVTFVNADLGLIHNVGGNGWGNFEDMAKGDAFTATFDGAGIYPFACQYHPGMTGAIVVGDGTGTGSGANITVEPFSAPAPETVTRVVTKEEGIPAGLGVAAGVVGLALGAGVAFGLLRSAAKRTPA